VIEVSACQAEGPPFRERAVGSLVDELGWEVQDGDRSMLIGHFERFF
jgi:hypothetical protein